MSRQLSFDIVINYQAYILVMRWILFLAAVVVAFTAHLAYGQLQVDNPKDKTALSQVGLAKPIIQKVSDKSIYNITIKSGQSSAQSGLNFEIVFLNATFKSTNTPPAGAESNITLDNPAAVGMTVPSVIEHVIPVKSFDITITSGDGKVLAKKMDEIPKGGRILENVNIGNYTGKITITLENIVPESDIVNVLDKQIKAPNKSNETALIDSAKIESQVVK